jgi:uncharacterized membrane protein
VARLRASTVAERLLWATSALYALVMLSFACARYFAFQYSRLDMGDMAQAVWSTAHGHFLETTTGAGQQMVRLGIHTDVFLAFLAPLWRVWPSPITFLALEAVAVTSGAFPVFWLARKHLASERAALFFALAYLLYPATQFNTFPETGFHAVSLAIPLLLFAIWFLDEGRLLAFAFAGLLAATTKEEVGLAVGLMGIWYGLRNGRRAVGVTIFVLGLAITVFNTVVVLPHFDHGAYAFDDYYAATGGTPRGILHTLVTNPAAIANTVGTGPKLLYVLLLLAPFLGLWLFEPLLILCAVPDLALNVLSTHPAQTSIQHHGDAVIVPVVVAASVFGLARIGRQLHRLSFYVLAAVAAITFYSPLLAATGNLAQANPSNPVHRAKAHAISLIPASAAVSATNQLGAYVSARTRITLFPVIAGDNWVIVDRFDPTMPRGPLSRAISRLGHSPAWTLVYSSRGVMVFAKTGRTPTPAV